MKGGVVAEAAVAAAAAAPADNPRVFAPTAPPASTPGFRADAATPQADRVRLQVKQVGTAAEVAAARSPSRCSIPTPPASSSDDAARRSGPAPHADRDAIRLLARFENQGPRRVGIDVRGEDASELLPLLKGLASSSSRR